MSAERELQDLQNVKSITKKALSRDRAFQWQAAISDAAGRYQIACAGCAYEIGETAGSS